jgi:hypothetical protein
VLDALQLARGIREQGYSVPRDWPFADTAELFNSYKAKEVEA